MNRLLFLGLLLVSLAAEANERSDMNNVVWNTPSKGASGSMPIGNGDIGLNVWVEPSGEIVFYISKTDAFSENGQLLKLGRVRVRLTPSLLVGGKVFRQELHLRQGEITIGAGGINIRVWVDANWPVVQCELEGHDSFTLEAAAELWRTKDREVNLETIAGSALSELRGSPKPIINLADTIAPFGTDRLVWYHRNATSIYPVVLENQHLASLLEKHPDPLLNRTSGVCMKGTDMVRADDHTLRSTRPHTRQRLSIYALTSQTETADAWLRQLESIVNTGDAIDLETARAAHANWWAKFWDRSWIRVSGSRDAETVTRGYALQRWMMACAGRGSLPVKFNGSIFTVDAVLRDRRSKEICEVDADYRMWGGNYWFQNSRLMYWPLVQSGDHDLLAPWFKMYRDSLPLALARTRIYFHHDGAYFPESMYFWGMPGNKSFGWNNRGFESVSHSVRYYWQGGIELVAMMLEEYNCTQDSEFARQTLIPLAEGITTFFDQHWKRDLSGKIRFEPSQSLETWTTSVVNPLPEIAGLKFILPRLIALTTALTDDTQRTSWKRLLSSLPPVPLGKTSAGRQILEPAEKYTSTRKSNAENAELYAVFPYRLYGVGRPDPEVALQTYMSRRFPGKTCWKQDGICAACIGLADEARAGVVANFEASDSQQRFPAFWRKGLDWTPDMDNGGVGMQTLQYMLMQTDGRSIRLLPAWPMEWSAEFRLCAPLQTVVTGKVRAGKLVDLQVSPEQRKTDVTVIGVKPK